MCIGPKRFQHTLLMAMSLSSGWAFSDSALGGQSDTAIHRTLAGFNQFVRADAQTEALTANQLSFFAQAIARPGTYGLSVDSSVALGGMAMSPTGTGALTTDRSTIITFTGRPVTGFAGTFFVLPTLSDAPSSGAITISTTGPGGGQSFQVPVADSGTFWGITSALPITSITFSGPTFEFVRDVRAGAAAVAPLAGDSCADAPTVTIGSFRFDTTDNSGITTNIAQPPTCTTLGPGFDNGNDVWFRFVPPGDGQVTIGTCGSTFDTILRVFNACPATGVTLTNIACNDDACDGTTPGLSTSSRVTFEGRCGVAVYIRVSGYAAASGTGMLSISQVLNCPADFNDQAGVTVQDIFDFLTAWFGGC